MTVNKLQDLCLFVTALMESYACMQHAFKLLLSAVYQAFKPWQYFLPLCLHLAPHPTLCLFLQTLSHTLSFVFLLTLICFFDGVELTG